jgi:predicted hotdog family 3-hydroxylacyl-ACP dehydratase
MMTDFNLDDIILHKPPMRLIDDILCIDENFAKCTAKISPNHLFYQADVDGVYAWIGIEMMAQTAAAYVYGITAGKEAQDVAKIAFLTSVRQFNASVDYYPCGSSLTVIAHKNLLEESYAVFDCEIWQEECKVASAKISAYQPKSSTEFNEEL